ncbi:MAG TPA: phosphoglucosamine mutase [Clostridiales bacterium]|jgi:phosphoglucosamine mutase|nr:phosphoglucosamine mutase [Clostridiales bacterium]
MSRLFGTDGVRGVANTELTPELAFQLGRAGAYVLSKDIKEPVILIGKDTRISGDMLEDALSAGIMSVGGHVVKVGVIPTPAIAYLVRHMDAAAGVVISASHNPFEFNGIKFFNRQGFKLDDAIEDEIEALIRTKTDVSSMIAGNRIGRIIQAETAAAAAYIDFLKTTVDESLDHLKIAIDCANGAAYQVAEQTLKSLGADVVVIGNEPDGTNINDNCGSTHPGRLQAAVREYRADIGLAFDGDADRLIAVDERGELVDGDKTIYICAHMLKNAGRLPDNRVTLTIMSNLGVLKTFAEDGCEVDLAAVGDRYVLENMLKTGSMIGGEQSGHIIFLDHNTTGDGILSGLQLLQAVQRSGRKLSELADEIPVYPQVLKNARVKNENKSRYHKDPEIAAAIKQLEERMAGEGRVLIRPSGTEPLVRVMIEGKDLDRITKMADSLVKLLTEKMN